MTILVVDDNESNIYQLQVLLGGNNYQVVTAANGSEALDKARQDPPDLIISDILMPVMDGFALCREWKRDERLWQIPFIFYTATYTDEQDREFALDIGADRFIVKPEDPDVFLQMILEITQQARIQSITPASGERKRIPSRVPEMEESVVLRQYSDVLIRTLERKMEQLAQAKRELERDIIERTQAEQALRESESCFRSLVEAAPEAIFVQSDGRFVYLNPAMLGLLGASAPESLIGTEFIDRIAPEYHEAIFERLRVQRETRKSAPLMAQEYLRLDGSRVPVETAAVPIRFQGRDSHLVYIRDISERMRTEAEKAGLEAKLRQAQKMEAIGRLAGGVAHDFNNLLTVILGYTETLLHAQKEGDPHRKPVETIRHAAQRAAGLTRQLLAFSRRQIIEPRILDLGEIVQNLEPMLRRLIGEDIDLRTSIPEGLGRVKTDPGQIEQILMNLAVNARDAMLEGGMLTIEIADVDLSEDYVNHQPGFTAGPFVMLAVTDTGTGMTPEVQQHLFEPFFTTKEEGKGTGLGLSTVFGIVQQSGGQILVYSEVDHGTTFKIYLPRVEETAEPIIRARKTAVTPRGTETILVAEDEDSVRELVREILQRSGYTVLEAENGVKALEVCEHYTGPLHLLISDVVMPQLGGKHLSDRLQEFRPGLNILFTSGYTDEAISHHGLLDPGIAFIHKPFSVANFLTKVREVLDAPAH